MHKRISLLFLLLFLLPTFVVMAETTPNGMKVFTCHEQGYTTLVDPTWRTEWVDSDGVYFHLGDGNMPYVLAWFNSGNNRVIDAETFFGEELSTLQERYSQNGATSITRHGSFAVGGKSVPAADLQYRNSEGIRIYLLIVVDVREDFTVIFRSRYLADVERQSILDALNMISSNLHLAEPATASASGSTRALSFIVTDIVEGGMVMGRCTVPADYQVTGRAICGTTAQSIRNPWLMYVTASTPGGIRMTYSSARDYFEVLQWDGGTQHQDGVYDPSLHTTMLRYMDAPAFCDYWATTIAPMGGKLTLMEENSYPELQSLLRQREQEAYDLANSPLQGTGISIDGVTYSLCSRRYALELDGIPCYLCVTAGIEAMQITSSLQGVYMPVVSSFINWNVPFTYTMICPTDDWETGSAVFTTFVGNTSTSDEFKQANERLADELWSIVNGRSDLSSGLSYSEDVMRDETASGDDYDDDRYTDYIFDQNDYTLSDGSHIKVSTAYDYVYEDSSGTVWYSDSAFTQPGGSMQLYPNR